jgi:hypothetical protein
MAAPTPRRRGKTRLVYFHLSEEVYNLIERRARKTGDSVSDLCRNNVLFTMFEDDPRITWLPPVSRSLTKPSHLNY